jgi:uncharacterized protein (UPF0276 family)
VRFVELVVRLIELVVRLLLRGRGRVRRVRELTVSAARDAFGLGWRPELAAAILLHRDRLDVVEVMADDYFDAPADELRALRTLAAQLPTVLHGVSLGLASATPVATARLSDMKRVFDAVTPRFWSEHLAFVRGGGVEIGHLAAPPRTPATVAGTAGNVARATTIVGARPLLENIATLIDPPGSVMPEIEWIGAVLEASGCDLLLDLHNLHANAVNFGHDARALLARLPAERIAAVHLAGGRRIGGGKILDDHLHDVPPAVFALLTEVGARVARPLTVILERDGRYPPIADLLAELDHARAALAAGRARALTRVAS